MNYKQGISREQISMMSSECHIGKDNPVRVIDIFVEQLDLGKLGFSKTTLNKEGRPCYEARHMLKLYYYGYLNKIRSSRKLEAECMRNVELWWLIYELTPSYHTIADFRKDNAASFKKAFKMFVAFLRGQDLFEGKTIAVDGTKMRSQNNKKNNFNEAKFAKSFEYIEAKAEEYIKELEACDAQEDKQACELKKKDVTKKLEELKERKQYYKELEDTMIKSGEKQISMSDPESRSLPIKDGITDVCFNIQAIADSKHSLIVEFETINTTDQGQLCPMATAAMEALRVKEITAIADKGYHTGQDLQDCKKGHITTIVAYPQRDNKNIDPAYQTSNFIYNKEQDEYTCPQGAALTTNGNEYEKKREGRSSYSVKRYVTDQCLSCLARYLCTKSKSKAIERSQYQDVVDENNKRTDENMLVYKTRQQIIEHPFGTIKRSWGYTYTLLKGMEKVNGEMAIIFTMYNIRRAMSILGVSELISRLKQWKAAYNSSKASILSSLLIHNFYRMRIAA
jgi:transposase